MLEYLKNLFFYPDTKYKAQAEAVIISCYFNPENSPYRLKAFNAFYDSIKHLNHRIIECVIGDVEPQLPENEFITRIHTDNLLWHKETLLNKIVADLNGQYNYIFWVDADVSFTNPNWLVEGVEQLQTNNIIQPFEFCIHLEQDQTKPSFNVERDKGFVADLVHRNPNMWRSFSANYVTTNYSDDLNYDKHGHVGFAWGARREILEAVPLYDRALIGGADHIIAHAAAGQICHNCISKSFTENLDEVVTWSHQFYSVAKGKIGFVKGDLYHTWHGDIDKRQYLKRIKDFTPKTKTITQKDQNGLYIHSDTNNKQYMKSYFQQREVPRTYSNDNSFIDGVITGEIISDLSANNYDNTVNYDYSDQPNVDVTHDVEMGGGSFGGGGASGSWGDADNTTTNDNENFS